MASWDVLNEVAFLLAEAFFKSQERWAPPDSLSWTQAAERLAVAVENLYTFRAKGEPPVALILSRINRTGRMLSVLAEQHRDDGEEQDANDAETMVLVLEEVACELSRFGR